ncbi:MAG: DUF3427 domain-containing protein [Ferroplasma sp.]
MLKKGIYEQLIDKKLSIELSKIESGNFSKIFKSNIEENEFTELALLYLYQNLKASMDTMDSKNKIIFVNKIAFLINENNIQNSGIDTASKPEKLEGILSKSSTNLIKPATSVLRPSLFTGSKQEPGLYSELQKEIMSSDEILFLISFIKWSGIRLILDELKSFTDNGGRLRIITTTYMGATDPKAIEILSQLKNTEIKISYDTKRTRLHAKTYVFKRNSGFSTAYIGSSNLSDPAISSGLEWNLKIAEKSQQETMEKINITFNSYWNSDEFESYDSTKFSMLNNAIKSEKKHDSNTNQYNFDLHPYVFQEKILEELQADRVLRGYTHNLIVSSTGTGKTMIAAFDYQRFIDGNKRPKLLYIAHREEILKQALATFRAVLKDPNFGELYVGNYKPAGYEYLFMSVQIFNSINFNTLTESDYYDYIIIDEFHHAAAHSYQKLLSYYKPKILLGLTATPERMDGKDILKYFNNHISAEIRLPEAIDRKLLCPFQYFIVTDSADLSAVSWKNGKYDVKELTDIYSNNASTANSRAELIYNSVIKYLDDIQSIKGIGFCVSIKHAQFMSEYFNSKGIASNFVASLSSEAERNQAREDLLNGSIKFIFAVDIYNEGIDIPEINTVLFLRPTESLTIFLQQLGRGLRLSKDKEYLTVLDFIGQANAKYDFSSKFLSLLVDKHKNIKSEIINGFYSLPAGCYVGMERVAKEYILNNISKSLNTKTGLLSKISEYYDNFGPNISILDFLERYGLEPSAIYKINNFARLLVDAGKTGNFNEPNEGMITSGLKKLSYIDSRTWIEFILSVLGKHKIDYSALSQNEMSMLDMFQFTFWRKPAMEAGFKNALECIYELDKSPILKSEIISLLEYRLSRVNFIEQEAVNHNDMPLKVHSSYTRDQALVALGYMSPENVREGVIYLKDKKIDVLFVTINKNENDYSMTTMYKDYILSNSLFHWESQSTTSDKSLTADRYFNADNVKNSVFLFVREYRNNELGAAPYKFLGPVTAESHEGTRPVSIIWKLITPLSSAMEEALSTVIKV